MERRGFVAAPLLGTIIFLAAILFVVHLVETEKTNVAIVVSETYHNNIVSTLENYRSDLGILFRVNVQRSVDRFLTSQGWDNFGLSNCDGYVTGACQTQGIPPRGFPKRSDYDNTFDYDNFAATSNYAGTGMTPPTGNLFASTSPLNREQENGQLDYHELRYATCSRITQIIKGSICSTNREYGISSWIGETASALAPGDAGYLPNKNSADGTEVAAYNALDAAGKQAADRYWAARGQISTEEPTYRYQGVTFTVPNREKVRQFINPAQCKISTSCTVSDPEYFYLRSQDPSVTDDNKCKGRPVCKCDTTGATCNNLFGDLVTVTAGNNLCSQLIGDNLFDCRNFAEESDPAKVNRCCDKVSNYDPRNRDAGKCCLPGMTNYGCDGQDHVVPGCEDGSFYIQVDVTANSEVYKSLPRVEAEDQAGNTVRSGALSDKNFASHISYPLFKYYDLAFRTYAMLAYGVGNGNRDVLDPKVNMRLLAYPTVGTAAVSQQDKDGVIDGWVVGPGAASTQGTPSDKRYQLRPSATNAATASAARNLYYNAVFGTPATSICRVLNDATYAPSPYYSGTGNPFNDIEIVTSASSGAFSIPLAGANKRVLLCTNSPSGLPRTIGVDAGNDANKGILKRMDTSQFEVYGINAPFYITQLSSFKIQIRDYNPARLVDSAPHVNDCDSATPTNDPACQQLVYNEFELALRPEHRNPEYKDANNLAPGGTGIPQITAPISAPDT